MLHCTAVFRHPLEQVVMAKEGWEGGEVLFAGGTDWAKVLVHADTEAVYSRNAPCADMHAQLCCLQIARGGSSKKQSDQEKLVSLYAVLMRFFKVRRRLAT